MSWFALKCSVFISQWAANIRRWEIPKCVSASTLLTSCFSSPLRFSCFVHIWSGMTVELMTDCLNMSALDKSDDEQISCAHAFDMTLFLQVDFNSLQTENLLLYLFKAGFLHKIETVSLTKQTRPQSVLSVNYSCIKVYQTSFWGNSNFFLMNAASLDKTKDRV